MKPLLALIIMLSSIQAFAHVVYKCTKAVDSTASRLYITDIQMPRYWLGAYGEVSPSKVEYNENESQCNLTIAAPSGALEDYTCDFVCKGFGNPCDLP